MNVRPVTLLLAATLALTLSSARAAEPAPRSREGKPAVAIEKTEYKGWPNCYRMSNGRIELIATTDVGPRIISLRVPGGPNEFKEFDGMIGKTGGDEWRIYGGHRLWHAPETRPRTYAPDNGPVQARVEGHTLHLIQPVEATTGIRKEISLTISEDAPRVRIVHRLRNEGQWPVELAPWALSVMAPGGAAFLPQPTKAHPDRRLPNRSLTLWPYTDMSDPRLVWGKEFFIVKSQDADRPTKIGVSANDGWAAYANHGRLFVKRFNYDESGRYPDFGSAVEIYTATGMLELETLGPLRTLSPGGAVEHLEEWHLLDGPAVTDEARARRAAEIIRRETAPPRAVP